MKCVASVKIVGVSDNLKGLDKLECLDVSELRL